MPKTVLITGASRGIGRACACAFAREDMNVVVNYNKSEDAALTLTKELESFGVRAICVRADVSKTDEERAMFELVNGFRKAIYWSNSKMEAHALRYSKGYAAKKGYTFWEKDFDGMAYKTMLRQLISKWGIMSIKMQTAMINDMTTISEDGKPTYDDSSDIDETAKVITVEPVEVKEVPKVEEKLEIKEAEPLDFEDAFFADAGL